jgi:MSHA pilin protein MshD
MSAKARGFTLVELIVLIVVIGITVVTVLLTFQIAVRASADPQVQKQAQAIAEAMLDEILLASYDALPGAPWPATPRSGYDDVADYNGFTTGVGGMVDIQGNAVSGLGQYNVSVAVAAPAGLNGVPDARRITVTVTGPGGVSLALDAYRVKYQ